MTRQRTVLGLVRRPGYEEILAASMKDLKPGIISVPMQKFATKMINNPLFQRHQEAIENGLESQQRTQIDHQIFEHRVQNIANFGGELGLSGGAQQVLAPSKKFVHPHRRRAAIQGQGDVEREEDERF